MFQSISLIKKYVSWSSVQLRACFRGLLGARNYVSGSFRVFLELTICSGSSLHLKSCFKGSFWS